MSAQRLDGKALAATMRAEIAARVAERAHAGKRAPGLAAVLVGEDPASQQYVKNKHKACHEAGLTTAVHRMPATTTAVSAQHRAWRKHRSALADIEALS